MTIEARHGKWYQMKKVDVVPPGVWLSDHSSKYSKENKAPVNKKTKLNNSRLVIFDIAFINPDTIQVRSSSRYRPVPDHFWTYSKEEINNNKKKLKKLLEKFGYPNITLRWKPTVSK